jgi:EpsI family protein
VVPAGMAVLLVGIVAFFPLWDGRLSGHLPARELSPPPAAQGWQMTGQAFADWLPHWVGMRRLLVENYAKGDTPVLLYVAYYVDQHRGAELASSGNFMVRQKHPRWQNVGQEVRTVTVAGHPMEVLEARLRTSDLSQRLLAWQWDRVHGKDMRNPYLIKLRQALSKVFGHGDEGFAFIIATPYTRDPAQAEKVLSDFLDGMKPALDRLADHP